MIKISPFTPIFFHPSTDGTGLGSSYDQTFAVTDHIVIQLIGKSADDVPSVSLVNLTSGNAYPVALSIYNINSEDVIYSNIITGLMPGYYSLTLEGEPSEPFKITDDARDLENTVLVQYSNKDNKQRKDAVFWMNSVQEFFDFRIPGGFKDNGWGFEVDCEQFVTGDNDIVNLYAREATLKTLTMGTQIGCPIWFGEMLNRILCCDYVYFNGQRYSRKGNSIPEPKEQIEGSRSFVFSQSMQKVVQWDNKLEEAHKLSLRRVDDNTYRESDSVPLKL